MLTCPICGLTCLEFIRMPEPKPDPHTDPDVNEPSQFTAPIASSLLAEILTDLELENDSGHVEEGE
jgi:hypothetical protein